MTEMFGEAWPPMSVPDLAPDDDDDINIEELWDLGILIYMIADAAALLYCFISFDFHESYSGLFTNEIRSCNFRLRKSSPLCAIAVKSLRIILRYGTRGVQ